MSRSGEADTFYREFEDAYMCLITLGLMFLQFLVCIHNDNNIMHCIIIWYYLDLFRRKEREENMRELINKSLYMQVL